MSVHYCADRYRGRTASVCIAAPEWHAISTSPGDPSNNCAHILMVAFADKDWLGQAPEKI